LKQFEKVNILFKISKTSQIIEKYFIPYININRIIYFCSGLSFINKYVEDILDKNGSEFIINDVDIHKYSKYILSDLKPIAISNIYIFNSNNTYNILKDALCKLKHDFEIKQNIINTSIIFKNIDLNSKKKYDLLFSSSSYNRWVKNSVLACEIFSHKRLINYNKIIIGKDFPPALKTIKNLTLIEVNIPHPEFIKMLKQTSVLFLPSYYDSMPNVLYEAIYNNVQPIVSDTIECSLLDQSHIFKLTDNNESIIDKIQDLINNNKPIYTDKCKLIQQTELEKFKKLLE
jgi:glycosyltransferase involved in cell wall biosynthesis